MITIDTPASVTDLVELSTVKADPNTPDDSSADTTLERLIDAASEAIAEHLGYKPWRQTYTETLPGKGSPGIVLTHAPIQSVSSVSIGGLTITDYMIEDARAGILWRQNGWPWSPQVYGESIADAPIVGTERRNVEVTYVAGWLLPGESNSDLPKAIEQAALETVVAWYGESGTGAADASSGPLVSLRIGNTAETYADPSESSSQATTIGVEPIPARALARLRPWRRDVSWSL